VAVCIRVSQLEEEVGLFSLVWERSEGSEVSGQGVEVEVVEEGAGAVMRTGSTAGSFQLEAAGGRMGGQTVSVGKSWLVVRWGEWEG
jgi:hypothetical protein